MTRSVCLLLLGAVLCAGAGGCGVEATPTSVIGTWQLTAIDGTQGQHASASDVFSMTLRGDRSVSYVSCLDPKFDSPTMLSCHEKLVCATGTQTFDGTHLVLRQTGRTDAMQGAVSFQPGMMVVSGTGLFGMTIATSYFRPIASLPTDCLALP